MKIKLMKKIPVLAVVLCCMVDNLFGQANDKNRMLLSNYTFSKDRDLVGQIWLGHGQERPKALTLLGESSGIFRLKGNRVFIQRKSIKPEAKWYDLILSAKADGGTVTDTFRIVNDEFNHNRVIAHRGAWKNTGATENSISSLQHAIEIGCEGSEFDVHMSADSGLFIHHDPDVSGLSIENTPSATLSQVKLSNGENLPTLEQYLREGIEQNRTKLILEIKVSRLGPDRSLDLTRKVVALVHQMGAQAWVDYISFGIDICKEIKRLDPFAHVAYLNGDLSPEQLAAEDFYGLDYHLSVLKKNEQWLKEAHKKKLTVNVWTVNKEEDMDWFLQRNIDFITTNEPETLLKKVK